MRLDQQHLVVRDASLTIAHILKREIPPRLENHAEVETFFEVPSKETPHVLEQIEAARKAGKVPITIALIDIPRSTQQQVSEFPVIREEDADGNIVEYKCNPPTYISPRYMLSVWTGEPLQDQVVHGILLNLFFQRGAFLPEDIRGNVIRTEPTPTITLDEKFDLQRQFQLWERLGHNYRPSMIYRVELRMDSYTKTAVRRVKERVLDFKKVEG
jgi:hypothetical protein